MAPLRIQADWAFANMGRKYPPGEKGEQQITANIRRFLGAWPKASKGMVEVDEADQANEHDITKDLVHRMLAKYYHGEVSAPMEPFKFGEEGAVSARDVFGDDRKDVLKAVAGVRMFAGFWQATPIITNPDLHPMGVMVEKTCEGLAHKSPHRVCVSCVYAMPRLATSAKNIPMIVHHNGHFPYNWPKGWAECRDSWCDIVREIKKDGVAQIVTIDSNKHGKTVQLHPQQVVLAGQQGIDKIIYIPGDSVRVRATGHPKRVDLNVDGHNGICRSTLLLPA